MGYISEMEKTMAGVKIGSRKAHPLHPSEIDGWVAVQQALNTLDTLRVSSN